MIHGRTFHLLLALAFAVGQWFAVVHGTQHQLSPADKLATCEVCIAGHASAGPPTAAALAVAFVPDTGAIAQPTAPPPQLQPLYRPPSRGPPSIPV